ncbi:hypothetical protein HUN01_01470 (plasmid) [Nostoc edaphicum CCNP1411]|uniref:Uncharacterized protein n=1 Tax=Nostoc edaphicum CCNP1411 TaxID=1472755 RepID=A0A7D7L870_9NOSO|nr:MULTISPECIES: hypothetical protein [Nostoc]MEA5600513.1 hypothetical protein [Nostoc sp. UHCC 0252]QMS86316.1 hypothetical protein HUN01_01470 [Nostoc edaphicum CCNP1411]
MPKFYLHRTGKIPTAIHPFVKQTALPQDKHKPSLFQGKIIPDVQNIAMSMYRMIYIAIAFVGRLRHRSSDSGQAAISKPLDRLK